MQLASEAARILDDHSSHAVTLHQPVIVSLVAMYFVQKPVAEKAGKRVV